MKHHARIDTLDELLRSPQGGAATLGPDVTRTPGLHAAYAKSITALRGFRFWRAADAGTYRPADGLWMPQRKAVALAHAYLCAQKVTPPPDPRTREAALVKMPTGTGKSAVIATIACASPLVKKTLILTPRSALVHQLSQDLSYRFWGKLRSVYHDFRVHEGLSAGEIAALTERIKSGHLKPIRLLNAEHYSGIFNERENTRQIVVGTFNALHRTLGLEPPAHRSMYGKMPSPVARSIRMLDSDAGVDADRQEANEEKFRDVLKSFDLVIVDEGHYEPAYSWSQSVVAIGAPTIIFTATPYRNDYKYFRIKGNFVFNLSWQEAVREKLIREVIVEGPRAAGGAGKRALAGAAQSPPAVKRRSYSALQFVREFTNTLARLPRGKKVIVHAATYRTLTDLQRAFYAICSDAAVLIHERVPADPRLSRDLAGASRRERETLAGLRFRHVTDTERHDGAEAARVWLHQYKLLEGIDESRFTEVWLYDGFGSARQVVQQIGRAIRRPDSKDTDGQVAVIRGSQLRLDDYEGAQTVAQQLEKRWRSYLGYEEYAEKQSATVFTAETQLIATLKRSAPYFQYISGEFRAGHLLDEQPTMSSFLLPRRGTVCRVNGVTTEKRHPEQLLDRLQEQVLEAMQLEERFDIKPVAAPEGEPIFANCRLIRYLAWNNSPFLSQHHLPEWRLGVMAIVWARRYVFLLDTEGICIDCSRLGLLSPEPQELKRLFPKSDSRRRGTAAPTRIVETSAIGLDIGELGVRSITLRKHALDEGYFDLAEASQVPTTVRGFGLLADRTARRRLSISRGSVADPTNQHVRLKDYIVWARDVASIMMDESIAPHGYFRRFATEVPALREEAAIPRSILLDVWDILDPSADLDEERRWNRDEVNRLLEFDTCCEVYAEQEEEEREPRYYFDFGPYQIKIEYSYKATIPPSGRYHISCDSLNEAIGIPSTEADEDRETAPGDRSFGRKLSHSLTRMINQEQAFRVVPERRGIVYSHSHFFQPDVDVSLLSMLEECSVEKVVSEKGDTQITNEREWPSRTLFGLMYGWAARKAAGLTGIAQDVAACSVIVCDDRTGEAVDFFAVDHDRRRVYLIHAKADHTVPGVSARKLQEVSRQAQASLAYAGSSRREFSLPREWMSKWSVVMKQANECVLTKTRLVKRASPKMTIEKAHRSIVDALSNPAYAREVVVLTAGLLSKAAAVAAFAAPDAMAQNELQFTYFLASLRTTFDRAGVRLRIVTNP
jgi:superfamily II DNA or RNA helicase